MLYAVRARMSKKLGIESGRLLTKLYRVKNRLLLRPRILLYADSRGVDIMQKKRRENPFLFYPGDLIRRYVVDYSILSKKHTTIADFLYEYEDKLQNYDAVVCHVGLVDFAPRTQSSAMNDLYLLKKKRYDAIFPFEKTLEHIENGLGVAYQGEVTANVFSQSMLEEYLVPRLKAIDNLIWVGHNRMIENWVGNYPGERPENVQMLYDYDMVVRRHIKNNVSFDDWKDDEVKMFTYDNIHFNRRGADILVERLLPVIRKVAGQ